ARSAGPQRWCGRMAGRTREDSACPRALKHSPKWSSLEWLRHLVNRIELPVVPQIEVRRAAVDPPVGRVHSKDAGHLVIRPRLSLGFIDELRKGVGALELHAVSQPLVQPKL